MRIYMMTDLEGVSGVLEFDDRKSTDAVAQKKRIFHRRLLTGEVNAAVAGAFDGGATYVLVNDGHGGGNTILFDELDERAEIIQGRERGRWFPHLDTSFDCVFSLGTHAMAGTPRAVLCHTYSRTVRHWKLNGERIGEFGVLALVAGYYNVPTVFCAGDSAGCDETKALIPDIVVAPVKEGLSRFSAKQLSHAKACELIRERAAEAVARIGEIPPATVGGPYTFRLEVFENSFDPEKPPAGGTVIDPTTVEYTEDDLLAAFGRLYTV